MNQPISSWSNISEDVSRCQALRMHEREQSESESESGGGGVRGGDDTDPFQGNLYCSAAQPGSDPARDV